MGTSPYEVRPVASGEEVGQAAELLASNGIPEIAREQEDEPGSVRLLLRDRSIGLREGRAHGSACLPGPRQ